MPTLNGVEFRIIEIEWSTYQNNVIQEVLNSDTVEVQNQGHGSDPVRIKGMVNNEKELDDFQEQFYSNGILTFIKDPASNKQYSVYALGSVKRESVRNLGLNSKIIFTCMIQLRYPYSESVDTITRSKSITTQNQEWSTDDDGNSLKTDGSVDAVPDIQITGGLGGGYVVDIYQSSQNGQTNLSSSNTIGQTFVPAGDSLEKVSIFLGGMTGFPMDLTMRIFDSVAMTNELGSDTISSGSTTGEKVFTFDPVIDIGNKDLMYFRLDSVIAGRLAGMYRSTANPYSDGAMYVSDVIQAANDLRFRNWTIKTKIKNPEIYNTEDSTVKCAIANDVLHGAIHRINADGTGTVEYNDDFTTGKYRYDGTNANCSCDDTNDELDIADDGYIYWQKDTKFPINGTPTLTSRINITSGTPTIQISINGTTWYDIDTAIVDDVETEYPLDSDGNLSLAGKTEFYFRIDCVKTAAATATIKYFELDINIHTIYAKNPKIAKGSSASTFRIDQDSDSGMACEVALIYKHKWWV